MGIHRRTARRLGTTPLPAVRHIERPRPGGLRSPLLQPYVAYLQDRWQAGCTNVSQLFRELVERGYPGGRTLLSQAVQAWRPPRRPPHERRHLRRLSVRWLCLRPPEQWEPHETTALQQVLADDPDLAVGHALVQRFRTVIATRDLDGLTPWLNDAQASGLPAFISLARASWRTGAQWKRR